MTYAILSLTEDPWQVFTLDLTIDGEAFHAQIEIRYLPAPDQWYLSIWDHAVGEMLVNQIPLICSYVLFRTLYAAKVGRNRQIQYTPFLMEKDEEHVKIHEAFS